MFACLLVGWLAGWLAGLLAAETALLCSTSTTVSCLFVCLLVWLACLFLFVLVFWFVWTGRTDGRRQTGTIVVVRGRLGLSWGLRVSFGFAWAWSDTYTPLRG